MALFSCSSSISDYISTLQLNVHWPYMQESLIEAELLFVSRHYRIALLEIPVDVHSVVPQLKIPSFGSYPNYGEEVFALARDKDLLLMARRGKMLQLQDCHMFRSHCLFVDYKLPNVMVIPWFFCCIITSLFM